VIDDRERAPSGPCIAGSEYLIIIIIIIIDHRVPGADRALVIGKRTLAVWSFSGIVRGNMTAVAFKGLDFIHNSSVIP
jgi:hypothetical protein